MKAIVAVLLIVLFGSAPSIAQAESLKTVHIVYLARDGDPAYAEIASDDGVFRPIPPVPFPGAELAVRDTRATAHAVGIAVRLDKDVLDEGADAVVEVHKIVDSGAMAIIVDLPLDDFLRVARAVPPNTMPLFNIRHPDDALRRDFCATSVFHVLPSTAMLTDSLAQFTVRKNWRNVLVLQGPLPADKVLSDSFRASAKKFGARIVDTKAFVFGNDPRQRDQTNVGLMTASENYDVLFIADTNRDFGRFVAYEQVSPRPVIGTTGLQASAWSFMAERFGAPQVNHRFQRVAHRDMTDGDWAAWVAIRSVLEAVERTKAMTAPAVAAALAHVDLELDVSKGVESSYRPWDHQLRQSIMLNSGDATVAYAPFDGFLHQRTTLDTLGTDEGEFACPGRAP